VAAIEDDRDRTRLLDDLAEQPVDLEVEQELWGIGGLEVIWDQRFAAERADAEVPRDALAVARVVDEHAIARGELLGGERFELAADVVCVGHLLALDGFALGIGQRRHQAPDLLLGNAQSRADEQLADGIDVVDAALQLVAGVVVDPDQQDVKLRFRGLLVRHDPLPWWPLGDATSRFTTAGAKDRVSATAAGRALGVPPRSNGSR